MNNTKSTTIQEDHHPQTVRVGEWETGLCDCFTHCVPNCLLVWTLPCVSLAQISSRIGFVKFTTMLLMSLLAYVLLIAYSIIALLYMTNVFKTHDDYDPNPLTLVPTTTFKLDEANGMLWLLQIVSASAGLTVLILLYQLRSKIRTRFQLPGSVYNDLVVSVCCGFCSIAQMATHVKSYKPGSCDFGPVDTLPAYP